MSETEQKLLEAIKLLEECHRILHPACKFSQGKLSLIPDYNLKNKVALFVKSIKTESDLPIYDLSDDIMVLA